MMDEVWKRRFATKKATAEEDEMSEIGKPGVMLGGVHVTKAVSDPNFFKEMPEFASIKAQIDMMHIDVNSKKGCSACNKRRLHTNIDGNFAAIVSRLEGERAKKFKKLVGIGEDRTLYVRAVNPATRQLILKQI